MSNSQSQTKYCLIGAGPAGLAAAKSFLEAGIPFDCLERESDIGGTWNIDTPSGLVYETTHLISSRRFTIFEDFPMPGEGHAFYPHHTVLLKYLKDYAAQFDLMPHIELGKCVTKVERVGEHWRVQVAGEARPRLYKGVVIANGHHSVPRMPTVPGTFAGEVMHSRDYKSPKQLRDRRIIVVGAGNSGCDIAVDAVHSGAKVIHSMRRGYWFLPKFILGWPTHGAMEYIESVPMPRWLKTRFYEFTMQLLAGPPERFGLPRPDYHLDQAHPTMGDDVLRLAGHGRITIKPAIDHFEGNKVMFVDGTTEEADLVVFATGYKVAYPFLDDRLVLDADGRSRLFLNAFHPEHDTLFVCGLVQVNGSAWRVADVQAQLMARYILASQHDPERARWFRTLMVDSQSRAGGDNFVATDRHLFEVNYFDYSKQLKRLIKRFPLAMAPVTSTAEASAGTLPAATARTIDHAA